MAELTEALKVLMNTGDLVARDGSRAPTLASRGIRVVALYFSAHWCPPCRQFTPILRNAHEEFRSTHPDAAGTFSVVFISSDRSKEDMLNYMREAHGNWPALEPSSILGSGLAAVLAIRGIPALIVLRVDDGTILCRDGRQEVTLHGAAALKEWSESVKDVDTSAVNLLDDNPTEVKEEALQILLKILGNILKDLSNPKYRCLKLSNPKIESKLLGANGAFEILFSVGFEEATDALILPLGASVYPLTAYHRALQDMSSRTHQSATAISGTSNRPAAIGANMLARPLSVPGATGDEEVLLGAGGRPFNLMSPENDFVAKLRGEHDLALAYEDPLSKDKVNEVVPLQKLRFKATEKYKMLKQADPSGEVTVDMYADVLVVELLHWFKTDFFKWFDAFECPDCNNEKTISSGCAPPTPQEKADGSGRVEMYTCPRCKRKFRFPRFHSRPVKLLETRIGRCGEWANCFAMILRALNYETRKVLDWTDHVWCEFYSNYQHRWIHVDPCENVMDKPLLYECGWKKKLNYCIAISIDEVQDVTWRYTSATSDTERKEFNKRRTLVKERWLTRTILKLSDEFQSSLEENRKRAIRERRLKEVVDLMFPLKRILSDVEKSGRQTGSLAWRLARGEAGSEEGVQLKAALLHGFELTDTEVSSRTFHLEYDVVADEYTRVSDKSSKIKGFQNGVMAMENIIRKEENDWKMVYLARSEKSSKASITWALNLSEINLSVKSVELLVNSKVYENGRVVWQLCGGNVCVLPSPGVTMRSDEMCGSKELKITALLSGGQGSVSWQHTQLFRSKMESGGGPQLRMIIKLQCDD